MVVLGVAMGVECAEGVACVEWPCLDMTVVLH